MKEKKKKPVVTQTQTKSTTNNPISLENTGNTGSINSNIDNIKESPLMTMPIKDDTPIKDTSKVKKPEEMNLQGDDNPINKEKESVLKEEDTIVNDKITEL